MRGNKEIKNKSQVTFIIILLLCVGFALEIQAQQIKVSGKVIDTLQTPLAYANILAIPENDNEDLRIAITEDNGSYKLDLSKNVCSY
jgi:hypothetical protein